MRNFEGHGGRECGEHRTLGARAWCCVCSEYCDPEQPCKGCELPMLREKLSRVRARAEKMSEAQAEGWASSMAATERVLGNEILELIDG